MLVNSSLTKRDIIDQVPISIVSCEAILKDRLGLLYVVASRVLPTILNTFQIQQRSQVAREIYSTQKQLKMKTEKTSSKLLKNQAIFDSFL